MIVDFTKIKTLHTNVILTKWMKSIQNIHKCTRWRVVQTDKEKYFECLLSSLSGNTMLGILKKMHRWKVGLQTNNRPANLCHLYMSFRCQRKELLFIIFFMSGNLLSFAGFLHFTLYVFIYTPVDAYRWFIYGFYPIRCFYEKIRKFTRLLNKILPVIRNKFGFT